MSANRAALKMKMFLQTSPSIFTTGHDKSFTDTRMHIFLRKRGTFWSFSGIRSAFLPFKTAQREQHIAASAVLPELRAHARQEQREHNFLAKHAHARAEKHGALKLCSA